MGGAVYRRGCLRAGCSEPGSVVGGAVYRQGRYMGGAVLTFSCFFWDINGADFHCWEINISSLM